MSVSEIAGYGYLYLIHHPTNYLDTQVLTGSRMH